MENKNFTYTLLYTKLVHFLAPHTRCVVQSIEIQSFTNEVLKKLTETYPHYLDVCSYLDIWPTYNRQRSA